ncbi:OmpA family protein [Methylobacter sp.]|uniref:OmpA family protein n=1 Tax=Methylobacter sp. TaxID=2051955 RepID=UPI0025EA2E1B|nr:OmpA family protein [Methylobacter sp.]
MRLIIIGLSIIFFTLSTIITFKALELPDPKNSLQDDQKLATSESNNAIKALGLPNPRISHQDEKLATSESNNVIERLAEDQNTNRAIVADLQGKITQLEEQLKTKQEALEDIKATDAKNRPRTLAVFSGWTFRPGKNGVNDVALSTIENFVGDIVASKGSRILIEGHTDNIPTGNRQIDNMDLSLRRARAIADILISRGISPKRISVIGYGDAHPIDSNDTKEGRAKNRRVEVKLLPKEPKEGKS